MLNCTLQLVLLITMAYLKKNYTLDHRENLNEFLKRYDSEATFHGSIQPT